MIDNPKSGSAFRRFFKLARRPTVFLAVSVTSGIIDYALYLLFTLAAGFSANISFTAARLLSSVFNFAANRKYVFASNGVKSPLGPSLFKYYTLVFIVIAAGNGIIASMKASLSAGNLLSKLTADIITISLSYIIQYRFVFTKR